MKATEELRARLQEETESLVEQLRGMGVARVILFGSLARGEVSLFSDIDLLVLFDEEGPARDLARRVYQHISAREGVDILAYNRDTFEQIKERPFFKRILKEGKVIYERPES